MPSLTTEELLNTRQNTHGDFGAQSTIAQIIKTALNSGVRWEDLTYAQKEALHMMAGKMSRIVTGDPNEPDHWDDIGGYAMLGKHGGNPYARTVDEDYKGEAQNVRA